LGLPFTFGLDALTYAFSLLMLTAIHAMPPAADTQPAGFATILEGVKYAGSRPELIGTYVVDIVAMTFASGLFRMTIWNETIPSHLRGRMAGIEQLSYMTGPLLGNARAGFAAERFGLARSIVGGGLICAAGVAACAAMLPAFWRYRNSKDA